MNRIVVGKSAIVKLSIIAFVTVLFTVLSLFGARQRAAASAFGPSPVNTNAPGEGNCTSCHVDFELDSGSGDVTISGIPASYTPGQQITVTVTATQADAVIYGFQMTAVDSAGLKAGSFEIPPASEERLQILLGVVGPDSIIREYVEHTSGGLSNGQFGFNSWVFTWTAPAQSVGRVDFFATANAANSDGGTGGDYIYSATKSINAAATPVSISGRVTTPAGIALRNTKVVITDSAGVQTTANTSSFGIYSFSNVPGSATYTLNVQSKRYRFSPKVVTPAGNLTGVDFVGLE